MLSAPFVFVRAAAPACRPLPSRLSRAVGLARGLAATVLVLSAALLVSPVPAVAAGDEAVERLRSGDIRDLVEIYVDPQTRATVRIRAAQRLHGQSERTVRSAINRVMREEAAVPYAIDLVEELEMVESAWDLMEDVTETEHGVRALAMMFRISNEDLLEEIHDAFEDLDADDAHAAAYLEAFRTGPLPPRTFAFLADLYVEGDLELDAEPGTSEAAAVFALLGLEVEGLDDLDEEARFELLADEKARRMRLLRAEDRAGAWIGREAQIDLSADELGWRGAFEVGPASIVRLGWGQLGPFRGENGTSDQAYVVRFDLLAERVPVDEDQGATPDGADGEGDDQADDPADGDAALSGEPEAVRFAFDFANRGIVAAQQGDDLFLESDRDTRVGFEYGRWHTIELRALQGERWEQIGTRVEVRIDGRPFFLQTIRRGFLSEISIGSGVSRLTIAGWRLEKLEGVEFAAGSGEDDQDDDGGMGSGRGGRGLGGRGSGNGGRR